MTSQSICLELNEDSMEQNIHRAFLPMMLLSQFSEAEASVCDVMTTITEKSQGSYLPTNPHKVVQRLVSCGYLQATGSRCSAGQRKRKTYAITEKGRAALEKYIDTYKTQTTAINQILDTGD